MRGTMARFFRALAWALPALAAISLVLLVQFGHISWTKQARGGQEEILGGQPIRAWAGIQSDHVHVGDKFLYSIYVLYRPSLVKLDIAALENSWSPRPFEELDIRTEDVEVGDDMRRYSHASRLFSVIPDPGTAYNMGPSYAPYVVVASGARDTAQIEKIPIFVSQRFSRVPPFPYLPIRGEITTIPEWAMTGTAALALVIFLLWAIIVIYRMGYAPRGITELSNPSSLADLYVCIGKSTEPTRARMREIERIAILWSEEVLGIAPHMFWTQQLPKDSDESLRQLHDALEHSYGREDPEEDIAHEAYDLLGRLMVSHDKSSREKSGGGKS